MALTYMTKDGYKKKMEEIAYLESVERPRVSAAIAEARDKGDLSENSEYDAAKEAQGMLEMKIAKLKDLVANARIIDESKLSTDEVAIMSKVKMKTPPTAWRWNTPSWPTPKPTSARRKSGPLPPSPRVCWATRKGMWWKSRFPPGQ